MKNARALTGLGRQEGRVEDGGGVWSCGRVCGNGEANVDTVFNKDGCGPSSLFRSCELE